MPEFSFVNMYAATFLSELKGDTKGRYTEKTKVIIPDQVFADRKAFEGKRIPGLYLRYGEEAFMRGAWLDSSAGDFVVRSWVDRLNTEIVTRLVSDLLAASYLLSVDNGGVRPAVKLSRDMDRVMKALMLTQEDTLYAEKPGISGWVKLIYCNAGWDVLADYTTNLEPVLGPINKWAEQFAHRNNEFGEFTVQRRAFAA
jgi:hypothetical protein